MMNINPRPILLTLFFALSICLLPLSCNGGGDDDDDGGAPNVPHSFTSSTNCLASGCHQGKHGGNYNNDLIPDKCLECHGGTPSGDDDDTSGDDDTNTGDDDTGDDDTGDDDTSGDDDTGDVTGPNVPHEYNSNTNCLSVFCHKGKHGGIYNDDPIPGKCLECHE